MGFVAPVGLSLALFVELLGWAIMASLFIIWRQTFGAMLQEAARALSFTVRIPHVWHHHFDLGHIFAVADEKISLWLEVNRDGLSIEIGWTWHALKETWEATAKAVEWLTHETDATFDWFQKIHIPNTVKTIVKAALPAVLLAKLIAAAIAHLRPQLVRTIRVVEHAIPAKAITIVRKAAPLALPVPLGIPRIRTRLRNLERSDLRVGKRLRKLEGIFAAGVFAGLLANALGVSLRCIRRGNLKNASRRVCGMDTDFLTSLLQDTLLLSGTLSLAEFADDLEAVIEPVTAAILDFVRA